MNCCGNDANENSPYEVNEISCSDGNDNDCDGNIDLNDSDCDLIPPSILTTSIDPYDPAVGYNVSLNVTATDNFAVDDKYANITLPNGSVVQVDLSGEYAPVIAGRHNVTFIVNDTNGNIDIFDDYFIAGNVLLNVQFNAVDSNLNGIPVNLTVYFSKTNKNIDLYSFNGIKLENHTDIDYDLFYDVLGLDASIRLNCVNLAVDNNGTIGISRNESVYDYLAVYGINSTYTICDAVVRIYYNNLNFNNEAGLRLSKCDAWDFAGEICMGGWTDITSQAVQNTVEDYFEVTVSGFSGFGIDEEEVAVEKAEVTDGRGGTSFYCGDGICTTASSVGENCENCPEDCGECPVEEEEKIEEEEERIPEEEKPSYKCTVPMIYLILMILLTALFSIILIKKYYRRPNINYERHKAVLFLSIVLLILFLFLMYCPLAKFMLILQFILFLIYILYENRSKIRIYYKTKTNKKIDWS